MKKNKSIGIFDSGVGGLSIARAIKSILPEENLVYFADIEFSPYGNKPKAIVKERSEAIVNFLMNQDCKAIVVACNTATVNSISHLRAKFAIPIIGVEPAIKPAALQSKTGVIGVLATQQTLASESFLQLAAKYAQTVNVETKACPDFVSLVENLNHNDEQAVEVAEHYIRPLLAKGCDQIILGCTHFSFLTPAISNVIGCEATIIDTAIPVAMEVKRKLHSLNLRTTNSIKGGVEFWTSAEPVKAMASINELWDENINASDVKHSIPCLEY